MSDSFQNVEHVLVVHVSDLHNAFRIWAALLEIKLWKAFFSDFVVWTSGCKICKSKSWRHWPHIYQKCPLCAFLEITKTIFLQRTGYFFSFSHLKKAFQNVFHCKGCFEVCKKWLWDLHVVGLFIWFLALVAHHLLLPHWLTH